MALSNGLIQLSLLALVFLSVRASTLFGVHQSGKYWGVRIDSSGSSSNSKFDLYPSFSHKTGSVSYDPVTSQSLFELYQPHAIAYGPMCKHSQNFEPQVLLNMSHVILERPELGSAIAGKISAFAMYNSQIYFLHFGSYMTDEDEIFHIFQIRKFQSCDECGQDPYDKDSSSSAFSLMFSVKCSVMVTEAVKLTSEEDPSLFDFEFEGGKSLKVSKQAGSNELNFYFQIGKIYNSESGGNTLNMILYRANSNGQTEEVHTEEVNHKYYDWKMYAIGSVDYKDGLLCWTTAEKLFCRADDGEVKAVIGRMEHITESICTGNDPQHLMDLSGVTIAKNRNGKQIIAFGCSPNSEVISGAGLVTMDSNGGKTMVSLKAGVSALSAGSIFTVRALQDDCSYEPRPKICVQMSPTTVPPPTTRRPKERDNKEKEEDKDEHRREEKDAIKDTKPPEGKAVSGGNAGGSAGQITYSLSLILSTVLFSVVAAILS